MGQSLWNSWSNRRQNQQNQEQNQHIQQHPQQPQQQQEQVIDKIKKKIRLNEEHNNQNIQNFQLQTKEEDFIECKIAFKIDKKILDVLKSHTQISLFQLELERLQASDIKMIRFHEIDFEIQQIVFQVIINISKIEEISDLIRQQIIDELIIREDNFSLDKLLYFLNKDLHSFQLIHNCQLRKIDSQNFQYVALNKYVEQIEHEFSHVKQLLIREQQWQFNNKQWEYLMKYQQDQFQQIMKDNQCFYEIINDKKENLSLLGENQLLIYYDYIQNWQCDAIVDAYDQSVEEKSYNFYDIDYDQYNQ